MKNSYLFIFCLLSILAGSCKKDDSRMVLEQATDTIRGKYKCVSMYYDGEALDLNNDGICSTDLKMELEDYVNARIAINDVIRISAAEDFYEEEFFDVHLPAQDIKYDKRSKRYSLLVDGLYGSNYYIPFSYQVNRDGCLELFVRNDLLPSISRSTNEFWDLDDEFRHIDIYYSCGNRIVSFKDGVLVIRIIGAYYDFHTEKFVTGPVELAYERVSYAVN